MPARLALLAALAAMSSAGRAADPQPDEKTNFSASVKALNTIFKRDADGSVTKKYIGRKLTVSGTVKEVTATGDGLSLALDGLPPTADDPSGGTVLFPPGHPDADAVKGLAAGTSVRVKGTIEGVVGTAFTLKDPVLVAPAAKAPAPAPQPVPKTRPGAKGPPAKVGPRPDPVPPPAAAGEKAVEAKFTALELTTSFRDDRTDKLFLRYAGKVVEVEGEVRTSERFARGDGWSLRLKGCEVPGIDDARVLMSFEADNPDLPKARKLAEGDKVTVRAEFLVNFGASIGLKEPRIVSVAAGAGVAGRKPDVADAAERFVKEAVADPKASAARLKGTVVELTGAVSAADPTSSRWGITLSAGKLKPADTFGVFAECAVPADDLERVWLLAAGQKVKVVGVLAGVEKDRVRLARCEVTELEPNPLPTVGAAAMAAAYAADEKEAAKKYGVRGDTKGMFLEGVVKETKDGQYGTQVWLEVPGALGVRVQIDRDEGRGLKAGDKVRLKAACRGYWKEEGAVLLFGRVLPPAADKK